MTSTVHPTACVDEGATIGEGSRIWHFVHVSSGARVGRNCSLGQNVFIGDRAEVGNNVKIQNNVSIYDDVFLEDDVFCGPSAVFTNVVNPRAGVERKSEYRPTRVRRGATIGANATIVCGVTLGEYSFIAAGSVVTTDIPDFALAMGVPARVTGWMSAHGEKLNFSGGSELTCPFDGSRYRLDQGKVTRTRAG